MMKKIRIFIVSLLVGTLIGCQEEEPSLDTVLVPTNLVVNSVVADDQSGNVTITPSADNALTFHVVFDPEADPKVVLNGESAHSRYTQSGQYTVPITVIAFGEGGISSSTTIFVELDVRLIIPAETLAKLAGGDGTNASSKRWVWDRTVGGHFGVGPLTNDFPEFFSAGPNQLEACLYDDVLVFGHDGNDNYSYTLEPGADNQVFINWTEVNRFFPDASPEQFADECRDITDQMAFDSNFVIIENGDDTRTLDTGNSFLSYWAVIPGQYQILELSENKLAVRGISQPFNGDDPLAWYSVFVPEDQSGPIEEEPETVFDTLVWSDEFDTNGAPDPINWTYDLGDGCPDLCGWGNGELQSYTNDPDNINVEDGVLKITVRNEDEYYYYDDFQLADSETNPQQSLQDFEGTPPEFTGFNGGSSAVIPNPDMSGINNSENVGEFTRSASSELSAGSYFDLTAPLDLSTNDRIQVKVWSPKVGAVVKLKLENTTNGSEAFEVDLTTSVANTWEQLTYDFSAAPDYDYDRIVIFFDFGVEGESSTRFTSARITSKGLQEFTYGRVEVKAKMPVGRGTWPAIWMLGGDVDTNPWPGAGEMDIMEHVGNQQDIVFGTTHDPNNHGGNARTGSIQVDGVSTEFQVYEMIWTESEIKFVVNGQVYHTVPNDPSLPYNKDFFFILNVAMGGTFGGEVDDSFTESSMEIDYIRMYQ